MMIKVAILFLLSIAALGIAVAVYLVLTDELSPREGLESVTLGVLVFVTGVYAFSTYKIQEATADQAEATRKQIEISREAVHAALDAERNAVRPIILLEDWKAFGRNGVAESVTVAYRNVGRGSALGLQVWLDYYPEGKLVSGAGTILHFGAGDRGECEWERGEEMQYLPTSLEEFDVVAGYADFYGQEFTSILTYDASENRAKLRIQRVDRADSLEPS